MKPTTVLMAIVFGSATAISFGLCATWVVFALLHSDHPELLSELPKLALSCLGFVVLSSVAGASLYGTFKQKRWRMAANCMAWLMVLLLGWAYWPKK